MSAEFKKLLQNEAELNEWTRIYFSEEASKDGLMDQFGLISTLGKLDLGNKKPTDDDVKSYFKGLGKTKINYDEFHAYLKKLIQSVVNA